MFLVWFRALWGATMGCFASKGAGPGAYEVSKLADAFEDRKSVDGAENSVTEGDQGFRVTTGRRVE